MRRRPEGPTPRPHSRRIILSRSPEETQRLGESIGRRLKSGDWIALEGDLGSGKTHLVQGIARGLGVTEPVASPTFVFIREFPGRFPFVHADLYRIELAEDVLDLGLLDYLNGPWVVAVEWAERAGSYFPAERLTIRLAHRNKTSREIRIGATGGRYRSLLKDLPEDDGTE